MRFSMEVTLVYASAYVKETVNNLLLLQMELHEVWLIASSDIWKQVWQWKQSGVVELERSEVTRLVVGGVF